MGTSTRRSRVRADTGRDDARYQQMVALLEGQSQILEMISQGDSLPQILDAIVRWVETQSQGGMLASLLLLDRDGQHLLHGAAPSLPDAYNQAIHGTQIGPAVGSCGTAAFSKATVIVEDIATNPLWAEFRDLALAHGLAACWSTPLIARDGRVLGTLGMYYRHSRRPSPDDTHLIQLVTRTAVVAIEHQQAEDEREQLRAREQQILRQVEVERQRLHDLFMEAPAAITVLRGPAHVFELANPLAMQAIGAGRIVLGQPVSAALPEMTAQGFIQRLDQVYATGEPYRGKEIHARLDRNADGHVEDAYFNFVYQPSRDVSGTVDGVLIFALDVTELVCSRQQIEESEAKFRTLADHIPQLVWMAHADGHIFWYNRKWYEYTGTSPETQEGWGWQSVHDPAVLPRVAEHWQQSLATGEPFEMIFPLKGVDGIFRPFLTRVLPVKDDQGQVVRWFGTNTDVTEQVRLQDALRASEQALQEANWRKDEFMGIASHELRTPLTSAKANIQVGLRRLDRVLAQPDAATVLAQVESLRSLLLRSETSLDRLAGLISDLLDVSRIQAGKLQMRPQRVNLAEVVREAVVEESAAWPERDVRLEGLLKPQPSDEPAPVWVEADPERVHQVVVNYISNALKYAPASEPIAVRLDMREDAAGEGAGGNAQRYAQVSVRDAGPGLTSEQQDLVFERFYRVDGRDPQQGSGFGLGLGLYICRTIIERHEGEVGVVSAPERGATFWFTLPLPTSDASA